MKKLILVFSAIAMLAVVSCNSNSNSSSKEENSKMNNDTMPMQETAKTAADIKMVATTFSNVDPGVAAYMKTLVENYIALKNDLANTNETGAADEAAKIENAMKNFDKSLLTGDQKKVYDDIADELKEHAAHIAKSKVDHQREHFAMMSKDVYDLVKAFGAGMTLYHDHCPMYSNGSMWLSETKDINNPFYGDKMMACGSVEETMK